MSNPFDLEKILAGVKEHPVRTVLMVAATIIVLTLMWRGEGFYREKGRQEAAKSEAEPVAERVIFQEVPKVRFTYYRFEGSTLLDYTSRGHAFSLSDGFEFNPDWQVNGVYTLLKQIVGLLEARYTLHAARSETLPYDVMGVYAGDKSGDVLQEEILDYYDEYTRPGSARSKQIRQHLLGALGPSRDTDLPESNFADLMQKLITDQYWTIGSISNYEEIDSDILRFTEFNFFAMPDSGVALQHLKDPIARKVLEARPDLRDVVFFLIRGGYWGGYPGLVLNRELKLLVLDIENVGDKPLGLATLSGRRLSTNDPFNVLTESEFHEQLGKAHRMEQAIPIEMLRPGEHLFIPLHFELGYAATIPNPGVNYNAERCLERSDIPSRWWSNWPRDPIILEEIVSVKDEGEYAAETRQVELPKSVLEAKPDYSKLIEDTYYLGEAVDIEEVVFRTGEGAMTPMSVRRFDPLNLVARGGFEKGSCPILYLRANGTWKRWRPVLIQAVTRSREGTDEVDLPTLGTTFRITEEEAETSFLDSIYLKISEASGRTWLLSPREYSELGDRDGRYLKLRKGDSIEISFDVPRDLEKAVDRKLVFAGFYVPDFLIASNQSSVLSNSASTSARP